MFNLKTIETMIKKFISRVTKTSTQREFEAMKLKQSLAGVKAGITRRLNKEAKIAEALVKSSKKTVSTSKKTTSKKTAKVSTNKVALTPRQIKNRNRKRALKAWVTIRAKA